MKTISEQLIQLNQIKSNIKQAIIDKGVSVSDSDGFATYANKISAISGGGSPSFPSGMCLGYSTFTELPELFRNMDWTTLDSLSYFFFNCSNIKSVTLTQLDNVASLEQCFNGCKAMTSVMLSRLYNVQSLRGAFLWNSALSQVTLNDLSNVYTMSGAFGGCKALRHIDLSGLGSVRIMRGLFDGCTMLTNVVLNGVGSNVTDMEYCFSNCSSLLSVSLTGIINVSSLSECFRNCSNITSIALPELTALTNLYGCFNRCFRLRSIVLSGLKSVKTMSMCFGTCSALTSMTLSGLSVLTNINYCFNSCTSLSTLIVDSWGTVITNLTSWGISTCTKLTHDSLMNIINALYTTNVTRVCTIGTTNLAKLTAEEKAIATSKGWTLN